MRTHLQFVALAFALFAAPLSAAASKRTLSEVEFQATSEVAQEIVGNYVRRDWDAMRALMSDEYAETWTDKRVQQVDGIYEQLLGPVERVMLADEIVESSPGCHAWRYAVAHRDQNATLLFDLCGSGRSWVIGRLGVAPSIDAVALLALRGVVRQMDYPGPWDYACEGADKARVGDSINCWLTRLDNRATTLVVLKRTDVAIVDIKSSLVVATAPEATRELLEPIAMAAATHIARGRFDELMRSASPTLNKDVGADRIGTMLSSLAALRGPVLETNWVEMSVREQAQVVDVTLEQVHADRKHALRLSFIPFRGDWVLFGVDPGAANDPAAVRVVSRNALPLGVRELTGDPAATIDCPWQELTPSHRNLVCKGIVYGQQVRITTEPREDSDTAVDIASDDLLVATASAIAKLTPVLGWSATRVECDNERTRPGETTECRVASPEGNRVLTIQRSQQGRAMVDNVLRR